MDDAFLQSLKQLYEKAETPIVLLEKDSFSVVWSNAKANQDRPTFLRAAAFEIPGREEIIRRLQQYGTAYYRLAPFPAVSDGVMFVNNGEYIVAMSDQTAGMPLPDNFISVDGMDFFTNIMRNGVDGITLSAQSIERMIDADNPEVDRLFGGIRRSSYKILRNVQNATLMSKYMTGSLILKKQNCNVNELCGAICLAAQSVCKSPVKINLTVPYDDVISEIDIKLAERALLNLLLNSMSYTRDGNEIDLTLSHTATQIMLTIKDKGAGIKSSNLPLVKEPYFSCEPADEGDVRPGLGLGLSIAAIFCNLHSGTLLIDSEYGEGTSVAMSIKKKMAEEDTFMASIADYVTDAFSPVYIEMCDICEIPY